MSVLLPAVVSERDECKGADEQEIDVQNLLKFWPNKI
jgi:hypothetical protein